MSEGITLERAILEDLPIGENFGVNVCGATGVIPGENSLCPLSSGGLIRRNGRHTRKVRYTVRICGPSATQESLFIEGAWKR
jgi:hypothetical protein